MDNIFIIGNGFDLAHGLKTSYSDFANYVINEKVNNNRDFPGITSKNISQIKFRERLNISSLAHTLFENRLFYEFYVSLKKENWSDIEKIYYQKLTDNDTKSNYYNKSKELNNELASIKENLIGYLSTQNNLAKSLKSFTSLFSTFNQKETLILNFNYTKTLNLYKTEKSKIINIHGQLEDNSNSIIFGYAASNEEQDELLKYDNNEYLKNIKRLNYNLSLNESQLIEYLQNCGGFEVHILGHSIGLSDKQVLKTVLSNSKLKKINIFHYNGNYFDLTANIYRILGSSSHKIPIKQLPLCTAMPQVIDDEIKYSTFRSYCQKLANNQ